MILPNLQQRAAQPGEIREPGRSLSWQELHGLALAWQESFKALAGRRVALVSESKLAGIGLLAIFEALGCEVGILPAGRVEAEWNWHTAFPAEFLVRADGRLQPEIVPCACGQHLSEVTAHTVTVFSSGTTGTPHPHHWEWKRLWDRVCVPARLRGGLWLTAYALDTFAGLQSALFGCLGAGSLAFVGPSGHLDSVLAGQEDVQLLMATPTFCRRELLGNEDNSTSARIANLTLGGEPVTAELLERLRERLPRCRVVHVYASTEFGSLFSVSDGLPGFPATWLGQRRAGGAAFEVREGQLYVSPADGQDFVPTGDWAQVDGDRVYIEGRLGEQINVGGYKVGVTRVESLVRAVPGVRDARARPIPSPLTGQLVAVDVVLLPGSDQDIVEAEIQRHFRLNARPAERPRKVVFVSELPMTPAGKTSRR